MTTPTRLTINGYRDGVVPNQFLRRDGETDHLAILLPGMGYTCDMPLFFYAQNLLEERGADILRVEYDYGRRPDYQRFSDDEQRQCLFEDADAAYRAGTGQRAYRTVTVIGKSLGTLAMGHLLTSFREERPAATRAVWLTPLLRDDALRAQMRAASARSLIAIGSADRHYDPASLDELRAKTGVMIVVEPDADHGFDIPGDVAGSIAAVGRVIDAFARFLTTTAHD